MEKTTVSEQELRQYFLEYLGELLDKKVFETQIAEIENNLYKKAFGSQPITGFNKPEFENSAKVLIRKWIWALIVQGKLIPGCGGDCTLPFLTITPEGAEWVRSETNSNDFFASTSQYMQRLSDLNIKLGDVAESYAKEAIHSYYSGCPKASMVMVGVAMEALMDDLYEALLHTQNVDWKNLVPEKKPYSYSKIIDKLNNVFETKYQEIKNITDIEKPKVFLTPMLEHLRQLRNDGAHASLPNHDVNEAFAMLEIFIRTATVICRLIVFLKNDSSL